MKKRYTEEQIINAIKEHEAGAKVDDLPLSQHLVLHVL
jgi:putative transposase